MAPKAVCNLQDGCDSNIWQMNGSKKDKAQS